MVAFTSGPYSTSFQSEPQPAPRADGIEQVVEVKIKVGWSGGGRLEERQMNDASMVMSGCFMGCPGCE